MGARNAVAGVGNRALPGHGYDRGMSPAEPASIAESPEHRRLRRFALASVITNVGIVITGATVRITGSGLGCPTWPRCDEDSFIPRGESEHSGWQMAIEFGNRMLTFVVLAAVAGLVWQLYRTRPHPPTLMRLAWVLPAGVIAQALVGGVVVRTGLAPWSVSIHFLLSMVLIFAALAVHDVVRRERPPDPSPRMVQHLTTAVMIVAFIVLVAGTITTGAGPHGGDPEAPRLALDIRIAALAHADLVWLLLGLSFALVLVTWSGPRPLAFAARALLGVELAQGVIGYTQYVLGVPEVLVILHVIGAAFVWTFVALAWVRARPEFGRSPGPDATGDRARSEPGTDAATAEGRANATPADPAGPAPPSSSEAGTEAAPPR